MRPDARAALAAGAAAALVALALNPGAVDNVDSRLVLRTAESLIDHGSFALRDVGGTPLGSVEYGAFDPSGAFQMKFGPGNAILAVPFVAAGRALLGPLAGADAGEAGFALATPFWFGAAAALLRSLTARLCGARAAWWAVAAHCFAGYGLVYGRSSYLETPLTACVLLAWLAAWRCREGGGWRPALALGAACGAALWIKTASALFLVGVPIVLSACGGRGVRASARALVAFAPLAALYLWSNDARFGDPFETGYAGSLRFDRPAAEGSFDLLFSERGLLFHAPLALAGAAALAFRGAGPAGFRAALAATAALAVPVHAAFFSPYGGDAWGPRYLVPLAALLAIPAGAAVAGALRRGGAARFAAGAAVGAGLALQAAPCVVSFRDHWSLRPWGADEAPPGPTLARIALHRVRGSVPGPADLGLRGPWPLRAPPLPEATDHWPARIASRAPDRPVLAGMCWAAAATSAAAGIALLVRSRRVA